MSNKIETLSQYALMASLWSIKMTDDLKEYGFAIGYNNKTYKSLDIIIEDTRKSISDMVEHDGLKQDIDTDEALNILFPKIRKTEAN